MKEKILEICEIEKQLKVYNEETFFDFIHSIIKINKN